MLRQGEEVLEGAGGVVKELSWTECIKEVEKGAGKPEPSEDDATSVRTILEGASWRAPKRRQSWRSP